MDEQASDDGHKQLSGTGGCAMKTCPGHTDGGSDICLGSGEAGRTTMASRGPSDARHY